MPVNDLGRLPCRLTSGVFSSEMIFELDLADGSCHEGVASRRYCFKMDGTEFAPGEPAGDQQVKGLLSAQMLRRRNGELLVSIPDGAVVTVRADHFKQVEDVTSVPVGPGSQMGD